MLTVLAFALAFAFVAAVQGSTPNGTYAPGYVQCPANFSIRPAKNSLSANETAWLQKRRTGIINALTSYLPLINLTGFNTTQFIQNITANTSYVPTTAMTISGGGYVATLTGLGAYQAMDARYPPALNAKTGGLAQCLTYLTGLSGGSAAVGTLAGNNYPTVAELVPQWNPTVNPFTGANLSNFAGYYGNLFEELGQKAQQGFNMSLSDLLGRLWSAEFIFGNNSGVSKTFSDIQGYSNFSQGLVPMPIICVVEDIKVNGSTSTEYDNIWVPAANATFFEYNPFEWGAWQGRASAFIPTQFLGTSMFNGSAINETCVEGFDQMGFSMGSSGSAWNLWLLEYLSNNTLGQFAKRDLDYLEHYVQKRQSRPDAANPQIISLIDAFEQAFNLTQNEVLYGVYPNPFQGYNNSMVNETTLSIVDGSESGQTIPLWPIIQPARDVDFIIAWDASGETPFGWQNGTNIIDTYNAATAAGLKFPKVPNAQTFIDFQYNQLPVFFGCYEEDVPLVLYMSNAPWTAYTNYSFVQSDFYPSQIDLVFENSFAQITYANNSGDPDWAACLACALVRGSMKKMGLNETAQCTGCWDRHCWKGSNTNKTIEQVIPYEPALLTIPGLSWEYWNTSIWGPYPDQSE